MAHVWPLLWSAGLDDTALERVQGAWCRTALAWPGLAWQGGGPLGRAQRRSGRLLVARRRAGALRLRRCARARMLAPKLPFDWPFHVGDLLWLLWLADPPATTAAMDLSRSSSPATQPRTSP